MDKQSSWKKLVQVAPLAKQKLIQTPVFQVIAVLCLLFIILGVVSGRNTKKDLHDAHDNYKNTSHTLNQNLAQINALKEEETLQSLKTNKPNYTSTPDGQKIGNPNAFRNEPPPRKSNRALLARMKAQTTLMHQDMMPSSESAPNSQDNAIGQVRAVQIAHPEYTLAAGEILSATLETAINSQLLGMVRAVTTRDIYSLNAANCLIPKGSILIGEYTSSGITQTQNRVLITWNRVQLPNGVIANINSPSGDNLGRAGLSANTIDHYYLERFGSSMLFSILGAYTADAGVNGLDGYNSATQYRMSIVQSMQRAASDSLQKNANLSPTLKIYQGTQINVFVAKDVSFYEVMRHA